MDGVSGRDRLSMYSRVRARERLRSWVAGAAGIRGPHDERLRGGTALPPGIPGRRAATGPRPARYYRTPVSMRFLRPDHFTPADGIRPLRVSVCVGG
jgi:hypothetical protein